MQTFDSCENLNLFQSSHKINTSPILDKNLSIINSFIELDYMQVSPSGLKFTNSGIEYMMKKHKEFLQNGGANLDFGPMASYKIQAKNPTPNINMKLNQNNSINISIDEEVDYNNINFKDKAPGDFLI